MILTGQTLQREEITSYSQSASVKMLSSIALALLLHPNLLKTSTSP